MRYFTLLFVTILLTNYSFGQKYKHFEGTIFYDVYLQKDKDSVPQKVNYLTLRIKDSLVRVDTNSDYFGGESTIRNVNQKKSYTLLKSKGQYYAIQNKETEPDSLKIKYSFKAIRGKSKIDHFKIKRALRIANNQRNDNDTVYYFTQIDPRYLDIFHNIKGLPSKYKVSINSKDQLIYKVFKVDTTPLSDKVFQIPSIFKIITFQDFINMQSSKEPSDK